MTTEELKDTGRALLRHGIETITRTGGGLPQQFHVIGQDGARHVLIIDGSITNSTAAKNALGLRVRALVQKTNAVAVFMMTDVYYAENPTPENEKFRQKFDLSISEMQRLGLYEPAEAVFVTLETPLIQWMVRQRYKRAGDKVTLVGEPVESPESVHMEGRFSEVFGPVKPG